MGIHSLVKGATVKEPFHKIVHTFLPYIAIMTAFCFIENVADGFFSQNTVVFFGGIFTDTIVISYGQ